MKITRPWGCSRLQSYKRFQRPHVPSGLLVPQHDSPTPPMTWDFHVRWQGRISKTRTFFHCRCFQCRFVLKITVSKQCDSGLPKLELRQAIPRSSSTTAWAMKPHLFQPEGNWCEKTSPPKKMVFCLGERLHYHQSLVSWLGLLYSQSAIATTSSSPDSRASRMRFLSCSSFSESMAIKLLRQDLARVYSDLRGFLQTKQQHRTNKTTQEVKVRSFQHRRVRFTLLWFTFVGHVLIQNISLYFLFKNK